MKSSSGMCPHPDVCPEEVLVCRRLHRRARRLCALLACCSACRRFAGRWTAGVRSTLLHWVVPMRAVPDAGGCCLKRHEGRFTDTPPGLATELLRHASITLPRGAGGAFSLVVAVLALPASGGQAGESVVRRGRVGPVSIRDSSTHASLACRESWRGRGCASGFMAATVQPKQFPRCCAASSHDKFFGPPGPPRCCGRCVVRPARPPPGGSPTRTR